MRERSGRHSRHPQDLPSRQFDDEQRVELFEPHGVHGEEVGGQHAVGLGAKELGPGLPAPWSGAQARSAQYPPDRGGRHADPELSQFALDPDTSPGLVLSTEANDEIDQLVAQRRSTGATLLPPPAPLVFGRFPVPSEQGVGGDQEGAPPVAREQSAEYSKDRSICRPIANPGVELAFENTHLVTKHHDLDVLVRLRAPGQHDEAEDPTQADVESEKATLNDVRVATRSASPGAQLGFWRPTPLFLSYKSRRRFTTRYGFVSPDLSRMKAHVNRCQSPLKSSAVMVVNSARDRGLSALPSRLAIPVVASSSNFLANLPFPKFGSTRAVAKRERRMDSAPPSICSPSAAARCRKIS